MRGECHPPDSGRPIVVVALGLRLVLVPFVRRRFADDPYRRYWSGKVASYAIVAVAVIAIVALWAPLGGRLSVILGFATAGIAFAMQEVIGALFGWVNILAGRIYTVGDRIEIAGVRGDVADITPPGIEHPAGSAPANRPGEWSRCQTGRPSPTPCSTSLRTWTGSGRRSCSACHKTPTGLARSGSSTRRSAGTRLREQGEAALAQLGERYLVSRAEVEPQTYIRVAEGDIEIVGRFVVAVRGARQAKDEILRRALERFFASCDVSAHHRVLSRCRHRGRRYRPLPGRQGVVSEPTLEG